MPLKSKLICVGGDATGEQVPEDGVVVEEGGAVPVVVKGAERGGVVGANEPVLVVVEPAGGTEPPCRKEKHTQ
jgi:hypothetical protein